VKPGFIPLTARRAVIRRFGAGGPPVSGTPCRYSALWGREPLNTGTPCRYFNVVLPDGMNYYFDGTAAEKKPSPK